MEKFIVETKPPGIYGFDGIYRFLSNFWFCPIEFGGLIYKSSEHAYQAAKTIDLQERLKIQNCDTAARAKKLGKKLKVRENWDQIKLGIMEELVRQKFTNNEDLKFKLLNTGELYLEETNGWSDFYWGVCKGVGENYLGKILMKIRDELKRDNPDFKLPESVNPYAPIYQ